MSSLTNENSWLQSKIGYDTDWKAEGTPSDGYMASGDLSEDEANKLRDICMKRFSSVGIQGEGIVDITSGEGEGAKRVLVKRDKIAAAIKTADSKVPHLAVKSIKAESDKKESAEVDKKEKASSSTIGPTEFNRVKDYINNIGGSPQKIKEISLIGNTYMALYEGNEGQAVTIDKKEFMDYLSKAPLSSEELDRVKNYINKHDKNQIPGGHVEELFAASKNTYWATTRKGGNMIQFKGNQIMELLQKANALNEKGK